MKRKFNAKIKYSEKDKPELQMNLEQVFYYIYNLKNYEQERQVKKNQRS